MEGLLSTGPTQSSLLGKTLRSEPIADIHILASLLQTPSIWQIVSYFPLHKHCIEQIHAPTTSLGLKTNINS